MTSNAGPWTGLVLVFGMGLAMISCKATSPASPSAAQTGPSATQPLAVTWTYHSVTAVESSLAGTSLAYLFTASATGGLAPYEFRWNFGDDTPEVVGNLLTHTFARPGEYTVLVTVTDAAGNAARSGAAEGVLVISAEGIFLGCFADPRAGESPLSVEFRAIMHNPIGRVTYRWDFADGTTSSERLTSHVYVVDSGVTTDFVATATATDSINQKVSCSKTIRVTTTPPRDTCPTDPNKTDPGICGCGVADTDGDGDGAPDCTDSCPADPNKTVPGSCGCGLVDTPGCGCPFVWTGSLWQATGAAASPTCTCTQNGVVVPVSGAGSYADSCFAQGGTPVTWTRGGTCNCRL